MTAQPPTSEFYLQVKQDSTVFSNIMFILEKLENENHLASLTSSLKSILEFEINFAQAELKKIRGCYPDFDFNAQLIQNTVIFKENLKLISNSLVDVIWSSVIKKIAALQPRADPPKTQHGLLKKYFEVISELSEEDFSRSQSLNNVEGTCIETSPVNRIGGHSDRFNFQGPPKPAHQPGTSMDGSGNLLERDARVLQSKTLPPPDSGRSSKLDRLIVDFINSSDSNEQKPSQSTNPPDSEFSEERLGAPTQIFQEYGQLQGRDQEDGTASEEETRGETLAMALLDSNAKKSGAETPAKCRSTPQMMAYAANKSATMSFEQDHKSACHTAGCGSEYQYPSIKGSLVKTGSAVSEKDRVGPHQMNSPLVEGQLQFKSDDTKRLSLCDYTNSSGEPNTSHYWLKRTSPVFKLGNSVSKELFGKKKSATGVPKTLSRKRHEVSSFDPQDNTKTFKKKDLGSGRGNGSPNPKGDLRNSSGKIRLLKS